MTRLSTFAYSIILAVGLSALGCTKHNKAFCCSAGSDCQSVGVSDGERLCDPGLVCVEHTCSVPIDAPPPQCTTDNECTGDTPHCSPDMLCVGCVTSDQCPSTAPACDPSTHQCRTCSLDDECASGVCDVPSGTCVAESSIAYASPTGSGTATCGQTDPCSIQRAFAITDANRTNVHLAPGAYNANLTVANKTVSVRGAGATISATTGSTLTVNDRGHLQLRGVIVVNAATTGNAESVVCESLNGVDTPTLELDDVQVESRNVAVFAGHCTATILRSKLHTTGSGSTLGGASGATVSVDQTSIEGGGYMVSATNGAAIRISSSIIGNPTSGRDAFFALGSVINVSFSTVVNAIATCGSTAAVCSGASPSGVCFDNSVVADLASGAPADSISGAGCFATWTLAFPQSAAISGSNNKLNVSPMLLDPGNGNYRLHSGSPAIDAADPAQTSGHDFDGSPRGRGGRSDMGAFEVQ